ncbi:UPF0187-domain-containing protein [Rhodotorula sp. JG-1b]|nr:UPF0187-domain-containing protein [Rhodotorula sp. JG-1b]
MATAISNALDSLADQLPDLPEVFPSRSLLAEAEEEDSRRIRPSRVGWWRDVCRVRGSALGRIWQSIVGFTIWASLVAVLDLVFERKIALTNNATPLLSVVVGLLLVFRNGSAYSRWDEGRKQWAKMMSISRSLVRTIWINVGAGSPVRGPNGSHSLLAESRPGLPVKAQNDKVSAARLVVAFLVATKRHIRREYGVNWPDLDHILTPNFKRVAAVTGSGWGAAEAELIRPSSGSNPAAAASNGDILLSRQRSRSSMLSQAERGRSQITPQERNAATRPPLASPNSFRSYGGGVQEGEREPLLSPPPPSTPRLRKKMSGLSAESSAILADYAAKPSLPLPLVIAHHLTLYFAACKRDGLIEAIGPAGFNALNQAVVQLVECFTTCERMANVDIPTIYGIHLKQCTSFFLATLPFVLIESMGFAMIPFVTLVAFTLCGIEGIATELEMPFGIDDSDLNLDLFCAEIRNEVEHIIMRLPASLDEWEI